MAGQFRDPELKRMMEQMRAEIAHEFGLPSVSDGQFGDASSKVCGQFGQVLYKRASELLPKSEK